MSKRSLVMFFMGAIAFVVLLAGTTSAHAAPIEDCNNPKGYLQLVGVTSTAAHIKNTSESCTTDVGMASYKKFDNNIDNQILFSSDTKSIGPGQTVWLYISLPGCAAQVDVFVGGLITSFKGGIRYGGRLLWSTQLGGNNYCTNKTPPVYVPPTAYCEYSNPSLTPYINAVVTFKDEHLNPLASNATFIVGNDNGQGKVTWIAGVQQGVPIGIIKVFINGVYMWTWDNCVYVPDKPTQTAEVPPTIVPSAVAAPAPILVLSGCSQHEGIIMDEFDRSHVIITLCGDPIVTAYPIGQGDPYVYRITEVSGRHKVSWSFKAKKIVITSPTSGKVLWMYTWN